MDQRERVIDLLVVPFFLLLGGLVALRLESDLSSRLAHPTSPYALAPDSETAYGPARDSAPPALSIPGSPAAAEGAAGPDGGTPPPAAYEPAPVPPLSDRVVMAWIEGLDLDTTAEVELTELRPLLREGSWAVLDAPLPVDPLPIGVSMLTGSMRSMHGVVGGFSVPPADLLARVGSLLEPLAERGRPARYLLAADPDAVAGFEPIAAATHALETSIEEAAARLANGSRESVLDLVHLGAPGSDDDRGGRDAELRAQRARAGRVNEQIASLRAGLDPGRDTLILVFFRGWTPLAGERGVWSRPRPVLVAHGRGIRSGGAAQGVEQDVAATVALLTGLPLPFANTGSPLLGILDAPDDILRRGAEALEHQRAAFRHHCAERFALGEPVRDDPDGERRVVAVRARHYRAAVLPQVVLGIVLTFALLLGVPRFHRVTAFLSGAAAGGVLLMVFLVVRGSSLDLLRFTDRGGYEGFAGGIVIYGTVIALLLVAGSIFLFPRRRGEGVGRIAQRALLAAFGCFVAFWGVATLSFLRFDLPSTGSPELNRWTLTYAASLLLLVVLSFAAVPGALLAWIRARGSVSR